MRSSPGSIFFVAGAKAPHQGYNHNVRHMGHVFHVQTEDSGGRNPHIETHVYYEGVILSSKRTPYADLMSGPNPDSAIRRLMQDQHKELLKDLRSGAMDDKITEALAKHKRKTPHGDGAPLGMKPLSDGKPSPTGDLPVAAPPDSRVRRGPTPPPAPPDSRARGAPTPLPAPPDSRARRVPTPVPVARPPVSRTKHEDRGAVRQSGVVLSRPVHVVGPGTRPVVARGHAGHAAAHATPAVSASTTPPPSARGAEHVLDLDAVILRYLIEDLEQGG